MQKVMVNALIQGSVFVSDNSINKSFRQRKPRINVFSVSVSTNKRSFRRESTHSKVK